MKTHPKGNEKMQSGSQTGSPGFPYHEQGPPQAKRTVRQDEVVAFLGCLGAARQSEFQIFSLMRLGFFSYLGAVLERLILMEEWGKGGSARVWIS